MAEGFNAKGAQQEFLEHANEEQLHADQIAERITQLGGEPDCKPGSKPDSKPGNEPASSKLGG